MHRVTKRILSHSQPNLKNSIGLTRKAFYWEKKEMVITTLTPAHLEEDRALENIGKSSVELPFSTAGFFTGVKESEAEIASLSSVTPTQ